MDSRWTGDASDKGWQSYLAGLRRFLEKDSLGAQLPVAVARSAARIQDASSSSNPAVVHVPSVAVLPFADMSGDKEQEYFSDGLAEEIINALAQLPNLKVVARTSAFAFKGQNTDIRRIAETLGVAHVLEGSVRRSGNRIRVTAQLITARDGLHLWSERYDRELAIALDPQYALAKPRNFCCRAGIWTQISSSPAFASRCSIPRARNLPKRCHSSRRRFLRRPCFNTLLRSMRHWWFARVSHAGDVKSSKHWVRAKPTERPGGWRLTSRWAECEDQREAKW